MEDDHGDHLAPGDRFLQKGLDDSSALHLLFTLFLLSLQGFHIFSINTAEPASVAWLDALLTTLGGRDEHFPFIVEDAELKEGKRCCCRPSTSRGPRGGEPGAHPARETPKHRLLPWQAPGGVSVGQAQVYPAPQHLV